MQSKSQAQFYPIFSVTSEAGSGADTADCARKVWFMLRKTAKNSSISPAKTQGAVRPSHAAVPAEGAAETG